LTKKNPLFRFDFEKPKVFKFIDFSKTLNFINLPKTICLHVFGFGKVIHSLFNIGANGGF
jgi:hypothetical protein